jgi:polyphosphate kinase
MVAYLKKTIHLGDEDIYHARGPVNLNRMAAVVDLVDRPDLKYPSFTPGLPSVLATAIDIFEVIGKEDVLLHHPFESFVPVIDFLRQAAGDPAVLAIKQTLYRTGPDSAVVDALVEAAMNGKEVTVVIELRARFDEAANIALATRLQDAGAHVVYGIVGFKTHAKMLMVVRREGKQLRRYIHLGTGNYHPRTARLYTDYGLFTADKLVGEDVHQIFLQLTSLGKVSRLHKLWESPFTLHENLLKRIEREAASARNGKPARIVAKMNSLVEPQIIQALYRASQAGVEIDVIVRGTCSLRPGIPGVSDRIRVRSVIGRFLEHTRVYCFENEGEQELFCASADWMGRNLFRRVEVCFPITAKRLRDRVMEELGYYLRDNTQAWELQPDGCYRRLSPAPGEKPFSAQAALLQRCAEAL